MLSALLITNEMFCPSSFSSIDNLGTSVVLGYLSINERTSGLGGDTARAGRTALRGSEG